MIKVIGAVGDIKDLDKFLEQISDFALKNKMIIQVLNADLIYGKDHLISAVEHAKRAIQRNTNTTNSLEMEILLYTSGERQLKLAIPKMGVKNGKSKIAFVLIAEKDISEKQLMETLSLKRDDKVLEGDIDTLKKFGINKHEIDTVNKEKYGDLILEKVAMVDIIK
jgi:KEOPS complex subunit Cgi121